MLKKGHHDPASAALVVILKELKMYATAQAVSDTIEQGAPAFQAAVPIVSQLVDVEMAELEFRAVPCLQGPGRVRLGS